MFSNISLFKGNKPFALYLLSQGITSLGDSFQFIAVTTLLVKVTGLSTIFGFNIILGAVISILILPIAAAIGDKFPEKYYLIVIDIIRGIIVLSFINNYNIYSIYVFLLILAALDSLYNPPRRKLITKLLGNKNLLEGNSLLAGIMGLVYMLGPVVAGIAIGYWGFNLAFIVNSMSFFFSVMIILLLKGNNSEYENVKNENRGIKDGLKYFYSSRNIREIVSVGTFIIFAAALSNTVFYKFSFDVLKVSNREWGLMISLFYGTNILGMLLAPRLCKIASKRLPSKIFILLLLVASAWILYGLTESLSVVLFLQIIEGSALCIFGIALISQLQVVTKSSFMARIIGINDIFNNFGRIFGTASAFICLNFLNYQLIFISGGVLLAIFVIYKMIGVKVIVRQKRLKY